jgi:hypothetical protein
MSSSDNGTGNHDPCFDVASRIGHVDVIFLFDALLHQANPSWATVLSPYYLWDDRKHVVSNLSYNLFEKVDISQWLRNRSCLIRSYSIGSALTTFLS